MAVNNAQAVAGEQTTAQAPSLAQDIEALVRYAVANGLLAPEDETWAYNAVLECVGATGPAAPHAAEMPTNTRLPPRATLPTPKTSSSSSCPQPMASISRRSSSASPPQALRTGARKTRHRAPIALPPA